MNKQSKETRNAETKGMIYGLFVCGVASASALAFYTEVGIFDSVTGSAAWTLPLGMTTASLYLRVMGRWVN